MILREPYAYIHDDAPLEGIFVHDDTLGVPCPGVLVIHEFMGLGEYMLPHAELLAQHGYAVLLADMYGTGIRPKTAKEASNLSHVYRDDRILMRARARAGLDALTNDRRVDTARLFSAGFSFGGCAVLELARSGADLLGTASFYGYLNTPYPCLPGVVKGGVLVLHGAHDKVVPMAEIPIFEQEMTAAGVAHQIQVYPEAGHGFANATHDTDTTTGSWYCKQTCDAAWESVLSYFKERM